MGSFHRHNVFFYCTNCIFYLLTLNPTLLHKIFLIFFFKKTVWFISWGPMKCPHGVKNDWYCYPSMIHKGHFILPWNSSVAFTVRRTLVFLRTLGLWRSLSSSGWRSGGACRTWSRAMITASSSSAPAVTWPLWPSAAEESCSGSASWRPCTSECGTPSPSPTAAPPRERRSGPTSALTCPTAGYTSTPLKRSSQKVTFAEKDWGSITFHASSVLISLTCRGQFAFPDSSTSIFDNKGFEE